MSLGDQILYISLATTIISIILLFITDFKKFEFIKKKIDYIQEYSKIFIFLSTVFLISSYLLLTYYFITSNFTIDYVWQYSSRELPLIYKISGTWAGQPGTYLLWAMVIFIFAFIFTITTKLESILSRRIQIINLILGIVFIILTLIQTPFKTIYEYPNVPPGFVPPDGSGLNALLVNFWMVIHPPVLFIGYAAVTIPFAGAIIYLITKDEKWEELIRQWARVAWFFLGLGIAIGGVWAYTVLGWGGFWAWDPVETASLVPWLSLTAYMHAASIYRKNKKTFSLATPLLMSITFVLVIYAAIVVRSGLFNSVHAFGETSTGSFLLILAIISALLSFGLVIKRYIESSDETENNIKYSFFSRTNIFYATLIILSILAFISFWGITFPVILQITQGIKVGIASDSKDFFNIWSYPAVIILLLAVGFCFSYKESEKEKQIKLLSGVFILTLVTMFLRTENFYVLDHNSPFFVSEPFIYKLIGSISLVSVFPPMIYALFSVITHFKSYNIGKIGISIIHIAIVLILLGAVISSTQTQAISANIPLSSKGNIVDIGNGYGILLEDYIKTSLTGSEETVSYPGTPISEISENIDKYENKTIEVSGRVTDSRLMEGHGLVVELTDNTGSLLVLFSENATIPENIGLTVTGTVISGFNRPLITPISVKELNIPSGKYSVQEVKLKVFHNNELIGKGTAEYLEGRGSGTIPLIDHDLKGGDVYVIFQGVSGGFVPLTLKIIPAINFTWIGVIFFGLGIIMIILKSLKMS